MSKFKDYSLPELYGKSNAGPQNPGQINWYAVALYGGITLAAVTLFAVIIVKSNKNHVKLWIEHSDEMNQSYLQALKNHETHLKSLSEKIAQEPIIAASNKNPIANSTETN